MQGTIAQGSLRQFTRALACLAKFADDACLSASSTELSLSACSSAQSAFGRVTFSWAFFDRYTLITPSSEPISQDSGAGAEESVTLGSVNLKSALSVLKTRSVQDSIDKCDIMIIQGLPSEGDEPGEYAGRFVIRFHCKNGVLKTHRLSLDIPEDDISPNVPSTAPTSTSRIVAGSLVIKDLLEHFGGFRKNDPSLQWEFGAVDVKVKTVVSGTKGTDAGIASEILVEVSEFMEYVVPDPPVCMNFPWREFNATTVLAESLNLPLIILFTSPGEPLWIEIDAPQQRSLFVVSTSPSSGYSRTRAAIWSGAPTRSTLGKRTRMSEAGGSSPNPRGRAVADNRGGGSSSSAHVTSAPDRQRHPRGPPHPAPQAAVPNTIQGQRILPQRVDDDDTGHQGMDLDSPIHPDAPLQSSRVARRDLSPESRNLRPRPRKERPLFHSTPEDHQAHGAMEFRASETPSGGHNAQCEKEDNSGGPPLSQLISADALEQIRAAGLGLEDLNAQEFDALMEEDGEELGMDFGLPQGTGIPHESQNRPNESMTPKDEGVGESAGDDWEEPSDVSYIPATQAPKVAMRGDKAFRPMFD